MEAKQERKAADKDKRQNPGNGFGGGCIPELSRGSGQFVLSQNLLSIWVMEVPLLSASLAFPLFFPVVSLQLEIVQDFTRCELTRQEQKGTGRRVQTEKPVFRSPQRPPPHPFCETRPYQSRSGAYPKKNMNLSSSTHCQLTGIQIPSLRNLCKLVAKSITHGRDITDYRRL